MSSFVLVNNRQIDNLLRSGLLLYTLLTPTASFRPRVHTTVIIFVFLLLVDVSLRTILLRI